MLRIIDINLLNNEVIFSIIILFMIWSALEIMRSSNPMDSILYMIFLYINGSIYLYYSGIGIMSLLYILIYVGGIAILFLFIISLLNIEEVERIRDVRGRGWVESILGSILVLILFISSYTQLITSNISVISHINWSEVYRLSEITTIGSLMYSETGPLMIYIAMILLLSMIGSIVIIMEKQK